MQHQYRLMLECSRAKGAPEYLIQGQPVALPRVLPIPERRFADLPELVSELDKAGCALEERRRAEKLLRRSIGLFLVVSEEQAVSLGLAGAHARRS
jgi:hypothetical protein